jgi:uncharacterized protein (TIGR03435 family)
MTNRIRLRLNVAKKVALGVAAVTVFTLPVVVGAVGVSPAAPAETREQEAVSESALAFEVASVKRSLTTATTGPDAGRYFRVSPSGIVAITNYSLRGLIVAAYGIERQFEPYTPEGGPDNILSTRFDIDAKVPIDTSTAQPPETAATIRSTAQLMLRTLLSERFNLRIHTETRQVPVYALTVAREGRLGPELRPSSRDCEAFGAARRAGATAEAPRDARDRLLCTVQVLRASISSSPGGVRPMIGQEERNAGPLTRLLSGIQGFVDRPLQDETGLTGNYEWQITTAMPGVETSEYPSMLTALQEQLGLKLEPRTAAIDVIVIDSVALPTPN